AAARRWERAAADPRLGARVYAARLLGADPALVVAGGGNCSVKSVWTDALGERRAVLWIKGSGADLAGIDAGGFAPLDLEPARRLVDLERLDDRDLMRELRRLRLDPDAPVPSVETLLHALLPARFVDHTHADAVLAVLLARDGRRRAEELWGEDHVLVPYVRPGHGLARRSAALWRAAERAGRSPIGLILLHHGVVTWGEDARQSYERMLATVARARRALAPRVAVAAARPQPGGGATWSARDLAALRGAIATCAGRPLVATLDASPATVRAASDPALARALVRGPLTPDHVLRTRPRPLTVAAPDEGAAAVERWAAAYRRDFERRRGDRGLAMLDAAPRVALLAGAGVLALGEDAAAARAALEITRHTLAVAAAAAALGGYRPLSVSDLLDFEYWEPERAKLARSHPPGPLAGRVALVTGAARGIGRAAVDALLAAGAAVAGLDLEATDRGRADYLGFTADATDARAVARALEATVRRFGGLDVLVSNVGVFLAGANLAELAEADWRRAFEVNATSHFLLLRAAAPLLELAPGGGAVIVIGSRNVPAPGPGAAAYSASKAALTQLARVAALELAPHGVRVNVLHPDSVFDTDLWTPELLAARAARYGLSVADYRRRNLLRREVRAADVGALAAALAGDLFRVTTGAQIPVDGGSDRVV
ncbi:MAG TPA: SDR family oxidoreductase, partial [Solirubrobacteraceae bacterium]|nr:SDR family oxidoreductase [Solirubrobacteraceae bacterium]